MIFGQILPTTMGDRRGEELSHGILSYFGHEKILPLN